MNKPVVICVDDEPTVLESLKIELRQVLGSNCLIETAEGGEEALELFQELQEEDFEVAVVLADYIMPGLRGDEFMEQVHALSPQTLNIMISGQADLEAVAYSIRHARLYRYIAKPWEPDELKETVVEAIQSYLQDRKLEAQTTRLHELYEQVLELNTNLEKQVQQRTAELEDAIANLERLSRLKDDFLNTVSHELRSPMSNIRMAAQMLEINLERLGILQSQPERVQRYFAILREECDREFALINALLDLARLDATMDPLVLVPVDLTVWLPHLIDAFEERASSNQQRLEVSIPAQLPPLITDLVELERTLIELLHNACKYTPPDGTIRVSVAIEFPENVASPPLPPLFQLEVRNSGVEIPLELRDRIFEQFYRIPDLDIHKQGGSGLGLPLVRRRVQRLGGSVEATSDTGWTILTVRLPQLSQTNGKR